MARAPLQKLIRPRWHDPIEVWATAIGIWGTILFFVIVLLALGRSAIAQTQSPVVVQPPPMIFCHKEHSVAWLIHAWEYDGQEMVQEVLTMYNSRTNVAGESECWVRQSFIPVFKSRTVAVVNGLATDTNGSSSPIYLSRVTTWLGAQYHVISDEVITPLMYEVRLRTPHRTVTADY